MTKWRGAIGLAMAMVGAAVALIVSATLVRAQIKDPALKGNWRGVVECRSGKTAYAHLRIQSRGFAEGGLSGDLSFDTTGASLKAWSRDGVTFQAERNAINWGVSSFKIVRVSSEEIELTTLGGYCATQGALGLERQDQVEDTYLFVAGGPQEWDGRAPTDTIAGRDFFTAAHAPAKTRGEQDLAHELARLRSQCNFSAVRVAAYGVAAQAFLATTTLRYATVGTGGRCGDGGHAAISAPSPMLWLNKELRFGSPLICLSRSEAPNFKACGLSGGAYVCSEAAKPYLGFNCGDHLLATRQETALALERSRPARCETTTFQSCERAPTGTLVNCQSSAPLTWCEGGPTVQRGPPLEPIAAKIGSWRNAAGELAVVRIVGVGGQPGLCPSTFEERRGRGQALECRCPKARARLPIWGGKDGVYSDHSDLCTAARHAGAIGEEGFVLVRPAPGQDAFPKTEGVGFASFAWKKSEHAFTVVKLPSESPQEIAARDAAARAAAADPARAPCGEYAPEDPRIVAEGSYLCSCAGPVRLERDIWGEEGWYRAGSAICVAALHAGHITLQGGQIRVSALDPRSRWAGSRANAVSARPSDDGQEPIEGFRVDPPSAPAPAKRARALTPSPMEATLALHRLSRQQIAERLAGRWSGALSSQAPEPRSITFGLDAQESGDTATATLESPGLACALDLKNVGEAPSPTTIFQVKEQRGKPCPKIRGLVISLLPNDRAIVSFGSISDNVVWTGEVQRQK